MTAAVIQQARALLEAGAVDPSISKADTLAALSALLAEAPVPMPERDNGGSAFPTGDHPDSKMYADYGMSLRDYFAAKAMAALICGRSWTHLDKQDDHFAIWARSAFSLADAMLAERAK